MVEDFECVRRGHALGCTTNTPGRTLASLVNPPRPPTLYSIGVSLLVFFWVISSLG